MGIPVLVADDDPISRMVICGCLEQWGFRPVEYQDGSSALEALLRDDAPRIAILDWMMPGKNGVDICAELQRRQGAFIYRILLTSRGGKEDLTYALDNGAHLFLTKPVDPEVLHSNLKVGRRLIETDDALLRMERIAAVGTLAGGIAHHYNNMNAGLTGYLDLLLNMPETTYAQRELLQKMDKICQRLQHVTEMMLVFSGANQSGKLSCRLDELAELVLEIERDKLAQDGVRLLTDLQPVPALNVDKNGLMQAMLHLLDNARHALTGRTGGQIVVSTGQLDGCAYFRVLDNGCGVPPQHLRDIFTPFFSLKGEHAAADCPQRQHKGYGLGLSVADNLARRHGGRIEVRSREHEGSSFTLFLPIS